MPTPTTFTTLQMEAALCIWEAMLEISAKPEGERDAFDIELEYRWDDYGAKHMRHVSYTLAPLACDVWQSMTESQMESMAPYDRKFIPAFVRCIDFEADFHHSGPHYVGDTDPVKILAKLFPEKPPELKAFMVRIRRWECFDIAVDAPSADAAIAAARDVWTHSPDPRRDFAIWESDWDVDSVDDQGKAEGEDNGN